MSNDTANPQESRVELLTLATLMIIFALFLLNGITDSLAMMAGGLVLLGSGLYQSRRGWHVSLTTWLLALILIGGGIGVRMFLVTRLRINWVAIALLLVGLYILWDKVRDRR